MAKGQLIRSETKKFKKPLNTQTFSIDITKDLAVQLAPEARFSISIVTENGELIYDSLAVNVVDYFINKVSLTFSKNSTEPGDENISLNIQTSNDSFVSLLAVDQSVLMMGASNDINKNLVSADLKKYIKDDNYCYNCLPNIPRYLGYSDTNSVIDSTGLFVMTNFYRWEPPPPPTWIPWFPFPMPDYEEGMVMPMMEEQVPVTEAMMMPTMLAEAIPQPTESAKSEVAAPAAPPPVVVRQEFPETWIWTDVQSNKNGSYTLNVKVPDTITSWVATGFSVNKIAGLGLSETPAKITVLKPFFISLELPYSIVRGEEFALQAAVSNYMGMDLEVKVKLLESTYFKVIECGNKTLVNKNITKTIKVVNNDVSSAYFWLVATSLGQIPIEILAWSGMSADAVKSQLLVKPEGQTQSYSTSTFIQLSAGKDFNTSFNITLPPKSILVEGDIIGSTMNNIDNLLQMPYGCGEQTLLNLVPDVFLLKYLTESGKLTAEFEGKAIGFITSGYQRELTYQRLDGSFSAFGNSDRAGSVWLSSFVIKCFHQAKKYIPIEDSKIANTMNWIVELQQDDGTFKEPPEGRVIHTDMQVDSEKLALTIKKSTSFLESQYSLYSSDPYALSIIAYAFFKAGSPKLSDVLSLLDALAIVEGELKYWKKDEDVQKDVSENVWFRPPYLQAKSSSIELASYVLLVYTQQKNLSKSMPVAKWLLRQRNSLGGFSSTQDTVLGLEALASFATLIAPSTSSNGITISCKGNTSPNAYLFDKITKETALFLQSYQLPEGTTAVDISATGEGVALVQLNVEYNVIKENTNKFLNLELSTNRDDKNLHLEISANWTGAEATGMVLIEINILTGYTFNNELDLRKQIGENLKKIEKSVNKVVLYLDQLTSDNLMFNILLEESLAVANVKPALVKIYRYYETGSAVTGFYSPSSGKTWEGACPNCCHRCIAPLWGCIFELAFLRDMTSTGGAIDFE
ncbi:hypothetical protein HELRODRAFT_180041 [Helobdella robusta]|uniref:Alpha-2-macroglobulin domain-containing protein n=1 Tax=Helobdella robusta TaxID=6412 RepID=T1FFD8_HELRO|nr:hypothetical protein HELRODRAFT_180041 [Helobdella robusta]ESN94934.1 hypothetical protein HELRODRAFT_180041 [Helobdella robusta]